MARPASPAVKTRLVPALQNGHRRAVGGRHHEAVPSTVVIFRAELGPDCPFWTEDGVGLDYSMFPELPDTLVESLRKWCEAQWDLEDGTPEAASWSATGRELFAASLAALGPNALLVW